MRFLPSLLSVVMFSACSCAIAQEPAAAPKKAKPPIVKQPLDPAVVSLADGVMRHNAALDVDEAYLPILFYSSHAANIYQLKNGDLICAWFSGDWEGTSKVGIVVSRLPKGSKQWTKTELVDNEEGSSFQNPMLFQSPDGVVHLYHTTQGAHMGEANAHVLEVTSSDNGKTWGKPALLFSKPGAFSRHPMLVLQDGTWLFPMTYVTSRGIDKGSETNYSVMELSKDQGKTWKECMVDKSFALVQPTVVELAPGRLLSFFRDRKSHWIYQSTSSDGCTWTEPAPTVLPNNNASVQAYRLKDGHIIMIFDNQRKGPRRPVTLALSEDEGKTWKYARDIEVGRPELGEESGAIRGAGREEYAYPSVMQARDGKIYAAFTFRRETIKVVALTEDWIRKGGTTGLYQPPAGK